MENKIEVMKISDEYFINLDNLIKWFIEQGKKCGDLTEMRFIVKVIERLSEMKK